MFIAWGYTSLKRHFVRILDFYTAWPLNGNAPETKKSKNKIAIWPIFTSLTYNFSRNWNVRWQLECRLAFRKKVIESRNRVSRVSFVKWPRKTADFNRVGQTYNQKGHISSHQRSYVFRTLTKSLRCKRVEHTGFYTFLHWINEELDKKKVENKAKFSSINYKNHRRN